MHRTFHRLGMVLLLVSSALAQAPPPGESEPPNANAARGRGGRNFSRAALTPEEQAQREERAKLARDFLDLSYTIGATMTASDRVKVLPRQIMTATAIDPELAAQWAEEALAFAQELPPGDEQDAVYASAIPALVSGDPEHALEVFRTLPAGTATGPAFNFALQRLFSAVVREQGAKGMEQVRQEALRLAQSSYYPYSAVLQAARELPTGDNQIREAFFDEASTAYRQGNRSPQGDAEFARMLMREWSRVRRPAAQSAFQSLTDNLLARAQREEQEAPSTSSLSSPSSSSPGAGAAPPSRDSADSILRRLLLVVRRFDTQLEQRILQARPALANSGIGRGRGGMQAGQFPPGGGFGGSPTQPQQQIGQQQQSALQFNQARRNPSGALTASTALTDPLARTLALVGAASGLARTDPAGASSALEQALSTADKIADPAQQLQAAATIAGVTAQMENGAALRAALTRGFQAAEVLQQSDDEAEISRAQFTLQRLARSGFQQDPALTLSFVDQVRMPATKANLLVEGAQALLRGQGRGGRGQRGGPSPGRGADGTQQQGISSEQSQVESPR